MAPKKSKKREKIIETTLDLLLKHGLKRISVDEICQKANVSKMTFYRQFTNKTNAASHALQHHFDIGYEWFSDLKEKDITVSEKIQAIINYKIEQTKKYSPSFIKELFDYDSDLHEFLMIQVKQGHKMYLDFIIEAQNKGEIRPEIKPEFILMLFEKIFELAKEQKAISLYNNYGEYIQEVFDFIHYGLLTSRKGSL